MRKKSVVIFMACITFFTFILGIVMLNASKLFAHAQNGDLYYSEHNAPVIYGTTKITMSKNAVQTFDITDARFRAFARDFEDGDIPLKCIANTVKPTVEGTYNIQYSATDSHNNTSTLNVPVTITNDTSKNITVERTIYTIPNDWNFKLMGVNRCNTGDRQNLGIYLPATASFQIRVLEGGKQSTIELLNNDKYTETRQTIAYNSADTEFTTIKNHYPTTNPSTGEVEGDYDCVPLLTSVILARGENILTTYKVEVKYNADEVHPLNYFREGDNQEEFQQVWELSQDNFSLVENEVATFLVTKEDMHAIEQYYFKTYDNCLAYYKKVINRMDEILGVSFNPKNAVHQNFRAKYLIKANKHGAGLAYYAGNYVAFNGDVMGSFFDMNWGGLHEIAHGYQGYLGKSEMQLGEVSNNILGHYIQMDKEIYTQNHDWLQKHQEDARNAERLDGLKFVDTSFQTRLYALINLFDYFEGADTYAKMFQFYREKLLSGEFTTATPNQDIYALFFAEVYDTNILPYWNQWGLTVNDNVIEAVQKASKSVSMLTDSAGSKRDEIMKGENLNLKYGLVTDSILEKYGVTANLTVEIVIQNTADIEGRKFFLEQSSKEKQQGTIQNGKVVFNNIPVGSYYLRAPVLNGYVRGVAFVTIMEGENAATIQYTLIETEVYHSTMLAIKGIYDTFGFKLQLENNNTTGKITLGGAALGNSNWGNRPDDIYCSVKILDTQGNEIYKKEVFGNGYFTTVTVPDEIVQLQEGYIVEIFTHATQRVNVYSMLTNEIIQEYAYTGATSSTGTTLQYKITRDGFVPLFKDADFSAADASYNALKGSVIAELDKIVEHFKQYPQNLENRYTDEKIKATFIENYYKLREEDRAAYTELMQKILAGGVPMIEILKEHIIVNQHTELNFADYVKVLDNEDKEIVLITGNHSIQANGDLQKSGTYDVTLTVRDSDGNTSSCRLRVQILNNAKQNTISTVLTTVLVVLGILLLIAVAIVLFFIFKSKKQKTYTTKR